MDRLSLETIFSDTAILSREATEFWRAHPRGVITTRTGTRFRLREGSSLDAPPALQYALSRTWYTYQGLLCWYKPMELNVKYFSDGLFDDKTMLTREVTDFWRAHPDGLVITLPTTYRMASADTTGPQLEHRHTERPDQPWVPTVSSYIWAPDPTSTDPETDTDSGEVAEYKLADSEASVPELEIRFLTSSPGVLSSEAVEFWKQNPTGILKTAYGHRFRVYDPDRTHLKSNTSIRVEHNNFDRDPYTWKLRRSYRLPSEQNTLISSNPTLAASYVKAAPVPTDPASGSSSPVLKITGRALAVNRVISPDVSQFWWDNPGGIVEDRDREWRIWQGPHGLSVWLQWRRKRSNERWEHVTSSYQLSEENPEKITVGYLSSGAVLTPTVTRFWQQNPTGIVKTSLGNCYRVYEPDRDLFNRKAIGSDIRLEHKNGTSWSLYGTKVRQDWRLPEVNPIPAHPESNNPESDSSSEKGNNMYHLYTVSCFDTETGDVVVKPDQVTARNIEQARTKLAWLVPEEKRDTLDNLKFVVVEES